MMDSDERATAAPDDALFTEQVDPLKALLNHRWTVVAFAGMGALLGLAVWHFLPPWYTSAAQILVLPKNAPLPVDGEFASRNTTLETHVALMTTPEILHKAIDKHDLDQLTSLADPKAWGGLAVGLSEASEEIIDLSFTGSNPDDCQVVVSAIAESYIDFIHESQQELNKEAIELITKTQTELLTAHSAKQQEYQSFRKEAKLLWKGEAALNLHQERLAAIEAERSQLRVRNSEVHAELDALHSALAKGGNREALLLMVGKYERLKGQVDPKALAQSSLLRELLPMVVQEQELLERYGPEHPTVQIHRKKMAVTRDTLEKVALSQQRRNAESDLLAVYMESLREEAAMIQTKLKELDKLYAEEQTASAKLAVEENRNRSLLEEVTHNRELFNVLLEKLQEVNLVKESEFLAVEIVRPPGRGSLTGPKLVHCLPMGIIFGGVLGFGLAFLLELSDKSFRNPGQIARQLGSPVVGHVPILRNRRRESAGTGMHPMLVSYHTPRSRSAEAYRAIRTPLLFAAKQENLKVVQITSPDPGDGKSTLSANFAITLAKSGKRCLLLDADFRRPKVHKMFGASNDVGFSSVLQDEVELPDAIQASEVENLDLITCGPRPPNPAELLLSPRFDECLQVLREKYDFIVVDTPPVLAVTDPSAVATKVDAVLIVLRITKRAQLHAKKARETLEMVGAKIFGVVVNGTGESDSYSYEAGLYSYRARRYPATYAYRQDYGYAGYGSYYAESHPDGNSV